MEELLPDTLEGVTDLFRVPLREFVSARNRLSKKLRREGFREESLRVKALVRPTLSAWALNRAYWSERSAFQAFLDSGARLRKVQRKVLSGAEQSGLKEAARANRQTLNTLMQICERLLKEAGHSGGQDTLRSIQRSLEAITVRWSDLPELLGRFTRDLKPPGFEELTGNLSASKTTDQPSPSSSGRSAEALQKANRAKQKVRTLELDLDRARESADFAAVEDGRAREELNRLKKKLRTLQSEVEAVGQKVMAAELELAETGRRVESTSRTVARVSEELARAKSALTDLE